LRARTPWKFSKKQCIKIGDTAPLSAKFGTMRVKNGLARADSPSLEQLF